MIFAFVAQLAIVSRKDSSETAGFSKARAMRFWVGL